MSIQVTEQGYKKCSIDNTPINGLTIFNKKLFHNDKIKYVNSEITLDSSLRNTFLIGGILKLTNSVQYGLSNNRKPIYEFIPINWKYPKFLVPSDIKNNCLKKKEEITDYFVVITFKEWKDRYPSGSIYRSIGPIKSLQNKYEILFYYYPESPYINSKFTLVESINIVPYTISECNSIYSIDPIGCKDIDDALSYNFLTKKIGVHIADVNYTIQKLNLEFTKYSTIYAPHKIINMLPDEITYNYCSLIKGLIRPVISCYIDINSDKFEFKREFIRVTENYNYDEVTSKMITSNQNIDIIFHYSQFINKKYKYVDEVKSSHEMVEVYMIFLNNKVAELLKNNNIIYRNQEPFNYAEYSYDNKGHSHMNLNYYTHFTSPIRRIVDQYIHQKLIQHLFEPTLEIKKLDIDKVNKFERELKKITQLWNYLYISNLITNGELFKLQFIGFDKNSIEFKLLEHNIIIYNKLLFDIIDQNTIKIMNNNYILNKIYELPIYVIDNIKNQYFPKIIIKF